VESEKDQATFHFAPDAQVTIEHLGGDLWLTLHQEVRRPQQGVE
jgi:hypothetical protein